MHKIGDYGLFTITSFLSYFFGDRLNSKDKKRIARDIASSDLECKWTEEALVEQGQQDSSDCQEGRSPES